MFDRGRQDIRVYVEELQIMESGVYPEQFLRPYVTEINGSLVDRIGERFHKSRRFTPSILAEIAHQFMVPDFKTRGLVEIPNGWGERRGRFFLKLRIVPGTGDHISQIVMGYTNSVGFTTRNVDPDMEFYVNSTFVLIPRSIRTNHGYEEVEVPTKTNDVLSDHFGDGLRRRGPELYTMRPEDVFSAIDVRDTTDLVEDLTDLRSTLSKNAIKSKTSNRIGSRFMAGVLDARQKALENVEYNTPAADLSATSQGYVNESFAGDDIFLRMLSNDRGVSYTVDNFTFRDLLRIDPDAEDRTDTMLFDDDARGASYYSEQSNPLDGQEEEDRIAALIAIAVPALMMETGLTVVRFAAHNQDREPGFVFVPKDFKAFGKKTDPIPFLEKFEERLIDELLMPITGGDQYELGLNLQCTLQGDVNFTLYYDGQDRGRYIVPVFCNSMSSPIVTDISQDVKSMSRNFNDLFNEFLPSELAGGGIRSTRNFDY